ncbi:helix-turn-helix transcriptional regulator [Lonsdalea quercina]|uniref:helix-turn-helix transcriptional regulator n=1 Tax=Lonsdalea quercina TaxID=71657 RepID=UPI003975124A
MQSPLRKLRKSQGFTLSHVASSVHVDPATLSRVERCEQVPSVELAEKLVKFFKGELSELHILYPGRYQALENGANKFPTNLTAN